MEEGPKNGSKRTYYNEYPPSPEEKQRRKDRRSLRHGLDGTGRLPIRGIENRLNAFRRNLEDAVLAVRGQISITDASLINSALKWERHGAFAQRLLYERAEELSANDQLRFSAEVAKGSDNRDKAIRQLNLDAPPEPLSLRDYLEQSAPANARPAS